MRKIVRPAYPLEMSIGLLLLIFVISFFLVGQVFAIPNPALNEGVNLYFGSFLISSAVIIMVLVLWEEFLFPIRINLEDKTVVFRNHRSKLVKQVLIYCAIPVIFGFVYMEYVVNDLRFFIWAGICVIAPVAGKLISGINNYNDFLKLNNDQIEYKNNKETGIFNVKDIRQIILVRDERKILHKIQLVLENNQITIDLDEMELEAFFIAIDTFISAHYPGLVKAANAE